jgi:hypothetical protein
MSGTINVKDQKILWGRAAGRCSMSDCRKKLTFDKTEESGSVTFGEMCHIVGEKNSSSSPRGISKLLEEDRNEYSNLILLCSNCHKIIDKDEKKLFIEILHKIKSDHELWVEESLAAKVLTPEMIVYANIIDKLNTHLRLDTFNWFIGNAVNNIVHRDFVDALEFVEERLLAIDWPNTNIELEKSIIDLMESFANYLNQFLKYSITSEPDYEFYREDKNYKRIFPNPNYGIISERNMLWAKKNFFLLSTFVYYLNEFVKKIRTEINPLFHLERGKFLIIDQYGMYNGGNSYLMLPILEDINKYLEILNPEIEKFENKNKNFC